MALLPIHLTPLLLAHESHHAHVVVACEDGTLACIAFTTGQELWRCKLPAACRGLCSLSRHTWPENRSLQSSIDNADSPQPGKRRKVLTEPNSCLMVCTAAGSLHLLCAIDGLEQVSPLRLPGQVFCQPAVMAGHVWVGARDDCLYCLQPEPRN